MEAQDAPRQRAFLVFVVGFPGCGKSLQCSRLCADLGFKYISIRDLLLAEVKTGSESGQIIEQSLSRGELVAKELVVPLLFHALSTLSAKTVLVEGFPRDVHQAVYFEQLVTTIDCILYYECEDEEVALQRSLQSDYGHSLGSAAARERIQVFRSQMDPVLKLYDEFLQVRRVDCSGAPEEVYERTLLALRPVMICVIGPAGAGKTTLALGLCRKYQFERVQVRCSSPPAKQLRLKEHALRASLSKQLNMHSRSGYVLLDGFPDTLVQAKRLDAVTRNCPKLVISLTCAKDAVLQRFAQLSRGAPDYISPVFLSKRYSEYEGKFLSHYYTQKLGESFACIDTATSAIETVAAAGEALVQPEVVLVRGEIDTRFLQYLRTRCGFRVVNVARLVRLWRKARTVLGVSQVKSLSDDPVLVPLLKSLLFNSLGVTKFALFNFALSDEAIFASFEETVARVKCCVFLHYGQRKISPDAVSVRLWSRHQLLFLQVERPSPWLKLVLEDSGLYRRVVDDYRHRNKAKVVFVLGIKYSGKTTIAQTLVSDYGFTLGSYSSLEEQAKARIGDSSDLTFTDFATEFRLLLANSPGKRFVFDSIPTLSQLRLPSGADFAAVSLSEEEGVLSSSDLAQIAARWSQLLSAYLSEYMESVLKAEVDAALVEQRARAACGVETELPPEVTLEIRNSQLVQFYLLETKRGSQNVPINNIDARSRPGLKHCLEALYQRRLILIRSQFPESVRPYLQQFAFDHKLTLLDCTEIQCPDAEMLPTLQQRTQSFISPQSSTTLILQYPFDSNAAPGSHFHTLLGLESAFGRLRGLITIAQLAATEDPAHESLPIRHRKNELSEVPSLLDGHSTAASTARLETTPMWNQHKTAGLTLVFQYYNGQKAKFARIKGEAGCYRQEIEGILKESLEQGETRLNVQIVVSDREETLRSELSAERYAPALEYYEELPLDVSNLGNFSQRIAQCFTNPSALSFHTRYLKYFTVPFSCFFERIKRVLDSEGVTISIGLRKAIQTLVDSSHTASVTAPDVNSFFEIWENPQQRQWLLDRARTLDLEAKTRGDTIGYKLLLIVVSAERDPVSGVASFQKGEMAVVTHEGCPVSSRFCADRVTYVGKQNPMMINDIIFHEAETRVQAYHFSILSKNSGYYFVDGGTPEGLKVQIEDFPVVLFTNAVLYFGSNMCVVRQTPMGHKPPSTEFVHIMDYISSDDYSSPPSPSQTLVLEFLSGRLFGRTFELRPGVKEIYTVGHSEDNDIVIANLAAPTHAWILFGDYGWAVVDMQSSDLTWICVNSHDRTQSGRSSPPLRVRNGMIVSVPGTRWKCVFKSDINFRVQVSDFVEVRVKEFRDVYEVGGKVGSGAYGEVFRCRHKGTGLVYAVKILKKSQIDQSLLFEIVALKRLDHPNIVRVLDIVDDSRCLYIVTELLRGGELFNRIAQMKRFAEAEAAEVMKQIMAAVSFLHSRNVVHRDIKPENLMYTSDDPHSLLKLIDFGAARVLLSNYKVSERIGTPYYMAPEVIKGKYDAKCDIWSCGVVLYIMLCGRPPFQGKNEVEIFSSIQAGPPSFSESTWKQISDPAKSLVRAMLTADPRARPTAVDVLDHIWVNLKAPGVDYTQPIAEKAFSNLRSFNASNKLQQAIMMFIANNLTSDAEKRYSMELFMEIDKDRSGLISKEELRAGFRLVHFEVTDEQIESIMEELDANMSGLIDYSEFLTGVASMDSLLSRERLNTMFSMFDSDGSGDITAQELKALLGQSEERWMALIDQVDNNKDGKIDVFEFKSLMLSYVDKDL